MTVHYGLFFALIVEQVGLGLWALVLGLRRRPIGSALATALIVDEGLILVQSVVGGVLLLQGRAPRLIHFLYGGLLIALLPIVYPYANRKPQRAALWIGVTLLFMAGLMSRACATGSR
jgi:hypothetical protein